MKQITAFIVIGAHAREEANIESGAKRLMNGTRIVINTNTTIDHNIIETNPKKYHVIAYKENVLFGYAVKHKTGWYLQTSSDTTTAIYGDLAALMRAYHFLTFMAEPV